MVELSWDQVHGQRHKLFDLLASMAEWVRYDEASGDGPEAARRAVVLPASASGTSRASASRGSAPSTRAAGSATGPTPRPGMRLRPPSRAVGVREASGPARAWAIEVETASRDEGPEPPTDSLRIGTRSTAARRWACHSRPCRRTSPSSARPAAARPGWPRWWPRRRSGSGVPVLAIDPQGDLVQFLRPAAEPPGLSDDDRSLRRAFLDRVEPRIWTPGSSHGRRLSLDPIRLPGRDELTRIADPDRREEEWQGMLGVAAAQLVGLAKVGGETDSQQTFLLQVLRSLASDARAATWTCDHRRRGLRPRGRRAGGSGSAHQEGGAQKLARKLNGLRLGPASGLFTGGSRLDLDAMCRPDAPGKTPLNVIYLNALTDDERKHFFLAALAAEIYRWMITSLDPAPGRPNLLFYLDEARDYIPAGGRSRRPRGR